MTGGQISPTSPKGSFGTTAPYGNLDSPFKLAELVAAAGASYSARWTTVQIENLVLSIKAGLKNKGFSFIEVATQCPTYFGRKNKLKTATAMAAVMKANTVFKSAADRMSARELEGKIVVGEFANIQKDEFTENLDLGKSASLFDEKEAVQTQSYGPEARGGASKCEVVISDTAVDYPKVQSPDILVAMSNEALIKYIVDLKDNGILIVDPGTTDVEDVRDFIEEHNIEVYEAPATKTATDEIGLKIVANIVMVGAITKITKVISKEAAIKAIEASVPKGTEEKNVAAFEAGYALAE